MEELPKISTLTKSALNAITTQRIVCMPEAVHEVDKLDLTMCSDSITHLNLNSSLSSKEKNDEKTDVISLYRKRPETLDHLSLEQYFYTIYCREKFKDDVAHRVLLVNGLQCKPVYPADFYYARGMILLHKPWSKRNPPENLFKNKEKTIKTFIRMYDEGELPTSVVLQYKIARKYSKVS